MTATKPAHGTEASYRVHLRAGEPPCAPCRAAGSAGVARRREIRALLDAGVASVPLELLGALLIAAPTELEERVEAVLGSMCVEVAIDAAERAADAPTMVEDAVLSEDDVLGVAS